LKSTVHDVSPFRDSEEVQPFPQLGSRLWYNILGSIGAASTTRLIGITKSLI